MGKMPVLRGERVVLRPIVAEDAAAMFAALGDEESNRLTGTQDQFTLAQVESFCQKIVMAEDRFDYAITLPDDPAATYIGEAILNEVDELNRSASFRIALAGADYFGRGYGTEATRLLVAYGFEVLKLNRIELEVYDFNPRAHHVYEKIGFVREGVRREVLLWEGVYHDAISMAMLAADYFAEKGSR